MTRILAFICSLALAALAVGPAEAQQQTSGVRFTCSADNVAASLTELSGCAAPSQAQAALRYYITDIVAQSTTATGGQFILRSGTGTNCGTGTASVLPSAASAARLAAAANTVSATVINLSVPIALPPGAALCVLGVATNTTTIQVNGILGP